MNFIEHFIAVYEYTAPPFARGDSTWSLDEKKVEAYKRAGNFMEDIHKK